MYIDDTLFDADLFKIMTELKTQLAANNIQLFDKMFDSGEDVMVCCPYHKNGQERKPSAGIRKSDGLFHCLACGETHTLPEVISYCFGYNDPFGREGYKWLCKNFLSVQIEERADIDLDFDRTVTKQATSYISEDELDTYRYVHKYMYERGLTDDVIEQFDIGYDKRTDSITFPVRYWGAVNNGACLFVAKRNIKYKRFDLPKNIDKPLYGLYEVWQRIECGDNITEIYVCEGLFDCLRLWCVGKYAVAGFGCLFSNYQITLLEGLPARKLILALDNDNAGRAATHRLKTILNNKIITEVTLPQGRKDIGECTDEELLKLEEYL